MSLLQLLNLPQPKHLALVQGGLSMPPAASASVASGAAPPHGSKPAEPKGAHANGSGEADVHAESKKARGAIEAREKEARETLLRFNKLAPLLDQKIAAATGDAKKRLLEQKGQFDKKTAEAVKTVDQARADLEVIDNPDSGREELLKIMARHRTGGKVSEEMEISSPGLDSTKKKVNHDVTTTTTAYEKGKATIETEHDKQHFGPGGVTREHSHEKEVHSADSIARNKEEKKSHVSVLGKASVEEKTVAEVELRDGRKSSVEHSTAKEISAKGAEKTETHKVTNLDGSSTATTKKQGAERGEGQVTATTSTSVTQTSNTGTAHTTDKKASGGFDAKDGAIGAHGGLDGGKSVTSKKGLQAGFVAGVHANVKCQIGEPKGEPKMYEVTLTVSFAATVGASAGAGKKEGSNATIGVEAKGSLEKGMSLTYTLSEAQLGDYTQALQDASKKGGKVSATHTEFAVISAGVNQGWEAARLMWSKQPVSKATADTLTHAGDSVTATEKKTGSLGGNLKVKGVGVAIGVTDSQEDSKKMTRNDKGGLDVDTTSAHTRQKSLSASLDVGVAGMEVGTVHTKQTSFGFSITIDPKYDPDGKILAALNLCETELQYNIFIATHPGKAVTVTGKMKGESDADRTTTGASLAGVKASIYTQQSVSKEQKFDGAGNLVHSKIVGGAGVGGDFTVIGDSKIDEATAEHDGDHNATLKLEQTKNDKDYGKMASNMVRKVPGGSHLVGEDKSKKDPKGALATAAGGEEDDTATKNVKGIRFTVKDLKRIGQIAITDPGRWARAHHRRQERDDWEAARREIEKAKGDPSVVADQLATFIGSDRTDRYEMVTMFVRGGNATNMGSAYEFPDSLKGLRADYERWIEAPFEPELEKLAAINPSTAEGLALSMSVAVDSLYTRFYQAKDFEKPALQAEMLGAITNRRNAIANAIRKYAGKTSTEDDRKATEAKVKRMLEHCFDFSSSEKKLFEDLDDDLKGYDKFNSSDGKEVKDWLRQLKDLRTRWRENYDEAVKLAKSIGMKQSAWDQDILRPNDAEYQKFFKAAERVGMV